MAHLPKRLWDSKKRAVRQGKQQVWEVDWELKLNWWNTWDEANPEEFEVYDKSVEEPQEPYVTYDKEWDPIEPTPTPTVEITAKIEQEGDDIVHLYFIDINYDVIVDLKYSRRYGYLSTIKKWNTSLYPNLNQSYLGDWQPFFYAFEIDSNWGGDPQTSISLWISPRLEWVKWKAEGEIDDQLKSLLNEFFQNPDNGATELQNYLRTQVSDPYITRTMLPIVVSSIVGKMETIPNDEQMSPETVTYTIRDDLWNPIFSFQYRYFSAVWAEVVGEAYITLGTFEGDSDDIDFLASIFNIWYEVSSAYKHQTRLGVQRIFSDERIYINGFSQELEFTGVANFKEELERYLNNPKDSSAKNDLLAIVNTLDDPIEPLIGTECVKLAIAMQDDQSNNVIKCMDLENGWSLILNHSNGEVTIYGDFEEQYKESVAAIFESFWDENTWHFGFVDYTNIDFSRNKSTLNDWFWQSFFPALYGDSTAADQLREKLWEIASSPSTNVMFYLWRYARDAI